MNKDQDGLPVQADGDANDQLQRVGMLMVAHKINPKAQELVSPFALGFAACSWLQPRPGIFVRHKGGNPDNVSADQLIGILAGLVMWEYTGSVKFMFREMLKRFGFAQNIVDGLDGDNTTRKLPDFMALRALPLFVRSLCGWEWLAYLFDWYLLVLIAGDWLYLKTDKDPCDVNNTLLTLIVCKEIYPTPISHFAAYLWPRICPGLYTRLERYHRAEALGNPVIATLFKPYIESRLT